MTEAAGPIDIISWNVNGLRAAERGGFLKWLRRSGASFVGVQEVRAEPEQLEPKLRKPRGWHSGFVSAERKGYSGVGYFSKLKPDAVVRGLGGPEFDREGRFVEVRLGALTIANAYFPNGNGSVLENGKRSNDRIPYKLAFYEAIFDRFAPRIAAGERVVVMGDFNTAHRDIDLARPKANRKTSGFTDQERAEVERWVRAGWTDTFRARYPDQEGAYSWWSQRCGVRERNIGWRIDMIMASPAALPFVSEAFIRSEVHGSDHCPIGVTLDAAVLG